MSNVSPLAVEHWHSPNCRPRTHVIDTITPHCFVGQVSLERMAKSFMNPARKAAPNYGISFDGKIGCFCDESKRSWCSSSRGNDDRAITIEVASDNYAPYKITTAAYSALVTLMTDICQRNHIPELRWENDPALIAHPDQQNITLHKWFAKKECPGAYIISKLPAIVREVNQRLAGTPTTKRYIMDISTGVPGGWSINIKEVTV